MLNPNGCVDAASSQFIFEVPVFGACELAMLKSVVEEMDARCPLRALGEGSGFEAIRAHPDGNGGVACNQNRLVAILPGRAFRVDARCVLCAAAIASGEHVNSLALLSK